MSPARRRLLVLLGTLVVLFVVLGIWRPLGEQDLRAAIEPLGWTALPAYVAISALLGVALLPGAVLATVAGLLFGPVRGVPASLAAGILSALLARWIARRVGRDGVAEVPSPRLRRAEALLEHRGVWAVIVQRLMPLVPDGPANHAAGLLKVRASHLAIGTLIGSAPRAVAYTVLGDALGGRDEGQAVLGAALVLATGAVGLALGALELRRLRRAAR